MAYSTSNPPKLLIGAFTKGNGPSIWTHESTDAASGVDLDGFITNAKDSGMQAGDIVFHTDTDASPVVMTTHTVSAINADGSADLSDTGATVGSTNSD